MRELQTAGLAAIVEKVVAGRQIALDDAVALSRASLPLLAKIVQQRSACKGRLPKSGLPVIRSSSLLESPRLVGQALTEWNDFCRQLLAARNELASCGGEVAWFPAVHEPLDRGCNTDYTGAEILRAIALARLILPSKVAVWAPLATLGPKLAHVALEFGASHLGYVALEGDSPTDPLVADMQMLDELATSLTETTQQESALNKPSPVTGDL